MFLSRVLILLCNKETLSARTMDGSLLLFSRMAARVRALLRVSQAEQNFIERFPKPRQAFVGGARAVDS